MGPPPESPMETDLEPTHVGTQLGTRNTQPSAAGPMETDGPSLGWQVRVPFQFSTPRSRPRTTAPTHPSGMWFCPMPRCACRDGASTTGWGYLQSLVSNLRSVHLSTGAAPPDAWLDSHGLRVCLACREITPQGSRCPVPRCSTAVLAALAWATRPPPCAGPLASGWASPIGAEPGAVAGNTDSHTAPGPYRGLIHVRPGTGLPAAGPGTGPDMGDPDPPAPIPPASPSRPPHGEGNRRGPPRHSSAG